MYVIILRSFCDSFFVLSISFDLLLSAVEVSSNFSNKCFVYLAAWETLLYRMFTWKDSDTSMSSEMYYSAMELKQSQPVLSGNFFIANLKKTLSMKSLS